MVKLNMDQCKELARAAAREALAPYPPVPFGYRDEAVVGAGLEGDQWMFEVYLTRPRPEDAVVLVEASVNRLTREVRVRVFPEHWQS